MVNFRPATISLDKLLLDPNNFRFKGPGEDTRVSEKRTPEASVQESALTRVKSDGIGELKRSIAENGFIPVERIVVRPFGNDDEDRYVVIEGNRRTAALKILKQEYEGGVDLAENVTKVFQSVPVLVADDATEEDSLAIMGIRHVGGPKEWGGYQSALLVYQLFQETNSAREVADRLGLSVQEVNRRYRAFGTLTQMMEDEDYGDAVTTDMYPIFHEAVGTPIVREWLGWSPSDRKFMHENNRELFYSWLSPDNGEPKIRSYSEVRTLKQILENEDALIALKDDNQSLVDALAIVHLEAKSRRWLPNTKSALNSLKEVGPDVVKTLGADELKILKELKELTAFIIEANALGAKADAAHS